MELQTLPSVGAEELGADELFFSTTNHRGIIRQGNAVFARVSGYPLDKLLGSPHNLVRHPAMPAGAFRLMWDALGLGDAVGTYVCNLTEAGSAYWVCAVVVPAEDGYLSVRIAPLTAGVEIARSVYEHAATVELAAARAGLPRREVAVRGAEAITEALAERGFPSYAHFMRAFVPAELASRQLGALHQQRRPSVTGGPGLVLSSTHLVAQELSRLISALTAYQRLGNELANTAAHLLATTSTLEQCVEAAQEASALVAAKVPVLVNVASVMATPMREATGELGTLPHHFAELHEHIQHLRFQIAQAALYNDTVAAFAAEVCDGIAPAESLSAIPLLVEVASPCIREMSEQIDRVNADLTRVASLVRGAGEHLSDLRRMIGRWRQLVMRHAASELAGRVAPVDEAVQATWAAAEELNRLGEQSADAILHIDAPALRAHFAQMRQGVADSYA